MIELLKLPELTFPVVGVGIGIPNQEPQLKPRMPREANVFEDSYRVFDSYLELLKDYDAEMEEYYDLRDTNRRVDSFTKQIAGKKANSVTAKINTTSRSTRLYILRYQRINTFWPTSTSPSWILVRSASATTS